VWIPTVSLQKRNPGNIHRVALLLLVARQVALAQQVHVLNNGTQIQGRYDGGNAQTVSFIDEEGNRHKFNMLKFRA
jgi:hypothetical protein